MSKKRNFALDILRVSAAIAVAVFHVLHSSTKNDPMVDVQLRKMITAVASALEWHVPIFFMITGYLWLGKNKECTYSKISSNIRRFILVLLTIGFAYAIMERYFSLRTISVKLLILAFMDVLSGNLWDHMWYVYSIIGIYLFLPVLKPFFEQSSVKSVFVFTGCLFAFTIIFPFIEAATGFAIPISFPVTTTVFYICTGGLIAQLSITPKKLSIYSAIIFLCSVIAVFMLQLFATAYNSWGSLLTCISAVSLFLTITSSFSNVSEISWVRTISDCSFGLYLFHPFFINMMIKVMHIYPLRWFPIVSICFTSFGIIVLSCLVTYLLRKNRLIRKYLL